jgi:hypothetical protein
MDVSGTTADVPVCTEGEGATARQNAEGESYEKNINRRRDPTGWLRNK